MGVGGVGGISFQQAAVCRLGAREHPAQGPWRLDLGGQGPLCSGGLPGIQGGVSRLPSSGSGQKTPFRSVFFCLSHCSLSHCSLSHCRGAFEQQAMCQEAPPRSGTAPAMNTANYRPLGGLGRRTVSGKQPPPGREGGSRPPRGGGGGYTPEIFGGRSSANLISLII
ncbi:unnamed protein product [Gadus morhua 'NCC']